MVIHTFSHLPNCFSLSTDVLPRGLKKQGLYPSVPEGNPLGQHQQLPGPREVPRIVSCVFRWAVPTRSSQRMEVLTQVTSTPRESTVSVHDPCSFYLHHGGKRDLSVVCPAGLNFSVYPVINAALLALC